MARLIWIGTLLAVLVVLERPPAWGAACSSACRDEISACRATECTGLTGKPRRRCRKSCAKDLVRDCYADLAVCGATTARPSPKKPAGGTGGGGGGGGGGGAPIGGW
jgi:hypothetical protein